MSCIYQFSQFIYKRDLCEIVLIIVLSIYIWAYCGKVLLRNIKAERVWKVFNIIVFSVMLVSVLYLTLFSRVATEEYTVCLIPFYSFYEAQWNAEMYRAMLMNVFLFVPLGLSLPNIFRECCKHKFWSSVLLMLVFSIVIEFLQYYYQLGRVEVDDVLCNTLGGMIGASAYVMTKKWAMIFTKGKCDKKQT